MSDLVGNLEDRFYLVAAHISTLTRYHVTPWAFIIGPIFFTIYKGGCPLKEVYIGIKIIAG